MAQQGRLSRRDAALYVTHDDGRVERVVIRERHVVVGRDERSDIRFLDRNIRLRHAAIFFASGDHLVKALSDGEIWINGVSTTDTQPLQNGDVLRFGGHEVRFVRLDHTSPTLLQFAICRLNEPHDVFVTNRPMLRIGHREGELRIADEFLGDPHCVIESPCTGMLFVVNQDKVRGTKLNGVRLLARHVLKDGDVLEMGTTTVYVSVYPGTAMPAPGHPLVGASQVALVAPDDASWDVSSGVTEVLDRREVRKANEARGGAPGPDSAPPASAGFESEPTWDGGARQPYYVPKGAVYSGDKAAVETEEGEGIHEGKTLQIPKVPKPAKKAKYYLPEEEK